MARSKKTSVQQALEVNPVQEKRIDPKVTDNSVIDLPSAQESRSPGTSPLVWMMTVADWMTPWGLDVAKRDRELRDFYPKESVLLSAIYSVAVRNASFKWEVIAADPRSSARNTKMAATRMLENIGSGRGWLRTIVKTCVSLYTQDNGAFWELVRQEDKPNSPVLTINVLDPLRCTRTGDPKIPVLYQDRRGKYHELSWYHVVPIEEMPSDIEEMYDVQMCAVTRALRMAQILRSIFVYKDEKVSGRNSRSIELVSGVTQTNIKDAIKLAQETNDNAGFARFSVAPIVTSIDPGSTISHERIDLASLPDNFAFDDEMKWYIAILAMAFGVDYQEFAPLQTGALGSGSQSEILHLKTHGKGPAAVMSLFEFLINNYVLPSTVKLQFKDHDARTETQKAEAAYTRGRDRALRVQSGELDVEAARNIAVEIGDLPIWIAEDMEERGMEATMTNEDVQPENVPETNSQNNPDGMQNTPEQISGPQRGAMQKQGIHQLDGIDPLSVTEEDVDKQRADLLTMLGEAHAAHS